MPKVFCSLPNASNNMNGVAFEAVDGGVLSETVSEEVAQAFAAVPGFSVVAGDDGADNADKGKAKGKAKEPKAGAPAGDDFSAE